MNTRKTSKNRLARRALKWLATGAAVIALSLACGDAALAKGGTAKPPGGGGGGGAVPPPPLPPQVVVPPPAAIGPIAFSTNGLNIHGFDVTGFMQDATVSNAACPSVADPRLFGGTVTVNGIEITVPCNLIMQMPASTWTWADLFTTPGVMEPLSFTDPAPRVLKYPSTEVSVTGNIVNGQHIAGLILVSQQSANLGTGIITAIDYSTGTIKVKSGAAGSAAESKLLINDPNGRFGRAQSPDPRFSVDDENPTIHAATGYPMCVPRTDPALADDPLCPQRNRPRVDPAKPFFGCRTFQDPTVNVTFIAGTVMNPPVAGQVYCSGFVMKAVNDPTRLATDPDAMQQAPFEVGDFIAWQGTMLQDGSGIISVHTIEASVGIYTQPNTLPAYIAIGEFGYSSDTAAALAAISGVAQEAQNRIFLEAMTTDVLSIVDVYLVDLDPATGGESQRWITPESMTGGIVQGSPLPILVSNGAGGLVPSTVSAGGITTQFVGAQPGRARIRATKATPGILVSPTRNVRAVLRSLCTPDVFDVDPVSGLPDPTKPSPNYTKTAAGAIVATPNTNINSVVSGFPAGSGRANNVTCLQSLPAANGLFAGQYSAPNFEFIFPENLVPGDPVVPYDFWDMGFLVNGEGPGTGPLIPTPW